MWFVGKPVLDLCGHLGTGAEKSAAEELTVRVVSEIKSVWLNMNARKTHTHLSQKLTTNNSSICQI